MKSFLMIVILGLLLVPLALAPSNEPYHLTLLAVQETDSGFVGSQADLYLEVQEGSGRVFLDTQPATKVDTQISTRFAKEIACEHYDLDCDNYDFIYTIKSSSSIIGGPSAGAAISALTAIAMMDLDYDEKVAITGTINSGAIVGPVGGVKEKIDAAQAAGLQKVLIAAGTNIEPSHKIAVTISGNNSNSTTITDSSDEDNKNNQSKLPEIFNFTTYKNENLHIDVVEVLNLDEVLFHLTGKNFTSEITQVIENEEYNLIMKELETVLCDRAQGLEQVIKKERIVLNESIQEAIDQKRGSSINASQRGDSYSAASFCFGNSITLRRELYIAQNVSSGQLKKYHVELEQKVGILKEKTKNVKIETISDLQALMIVQERLHDVEEQLGELSEKIEKNEIQDAIALVAYAQERLFSAESWMKFFEMDGKKYLVDDTLLSNACTQKIAEAQERHQYTTLFLNPDQISHLQEKLDQARGAQARGEKALCLIIASQVKSDANAILSSFGLDDDSAKAYYESKKDAALRIIAHNSAEGMFPILGYSYFEYAQALSEKEVYTSLLYLEYALEMSDLQIYFPEERSNFEGISEMFNREEIKHIFQGILIGSLITLILCLLFLRRRPHLDFVKYR
ncbi:hypothetical protein HYV86_00580 [Candidatus Woesearchaeota archaeon]|nr:hypothetical protein [Candidatus Woesearchaeota archaeon]